MRSFLPTDTKLNIVQKVKNSQSTVAELAEAHNVSRKAIYSWLKEDNLEPKYQSNAKDIKKNLLRLVSKSPTGTYDNYATALGVSPSKVYTTLKGEGLEKLEDRNSYAKSYEATVRLDPNVKVEIVRQVINFNKSVTQVASDYGVSRKAIYKWIKDYQNGSSLECNYACGANHPKFISDNYSPKILNLVINNPKLNIRDIASNLNISNWLVWKVLKANGLENYYKRMEYSAKNIPQVAEKPTPIYSQNFSPIDAYHLTPNLMAVPPPKENISAFAFFSNVAKILTSSFTIPFLLTVAYLFLNNGIGGVGSLFSYFALLVGFVFLLYSLKYYLSLAVVLSYYEKPDEGEKVKPTFTNIISWILGNKKGYSFATSRHAGLSPNLAMTNLDTKPFVSVQIPFYNEKNVVRRAIEAAVNFDYPNYEIILCDDSTDETSQIIREYQNKYLFKGESLNEVKGDGWTMTSIEVKPGIYLKHLHRSTRVGFKGASLALALKLINQKTEFISIFDADFVPYPDSLTTFLKYFKVQNNNSEDYSASNIAVVQGYQWHILNKSENWITKGVRSEYAGSYVIERSGAEIYGGLKQVSGSVYMIRREPLEKVGWGSSITEDFELTLKLYEQGYKVLYTPYIQSPAECTSTLKRLIRQRMRWAEGHSFNVKKMFWRLLNSKNLTKIEKLEFLYLSPYYLQALFFLVGTFCWVVAEIFFRSRLSMWTEVWGWSLILTNLLALPLVNSVGLFIEDSSAKDYSGILSFIVLSYIVVPFQAYAAVKGFLEKEEGTWFRTPKTGRITDLFGALRFKHFAFDFFKSEVEENDIPKQTFAYRTFSAGGSDAPRKSISWAGKVSIVVIIISTLALGSLSNIDINEISKSFIKSPLVSTKSEYSPEEKPQFSLSLNKSKIFGATPVNAESNDSNVTAKLIYRNSEVEGNPIEIKRDANNKYSISVNRPKFFRPGKYQLKVSAIDANGKKKDYQEDFDWGVLAVNTQKSIYTYGEDIKFGFGVVDDLGRTVCDAKLDLEITIPSQKKTYSLTSVNGGIKQSGYCAPENVTNTADYLADFKASNVTEDYQLNLTAVSYNGTHSVNSKVKIVKDVPLVVSRDSYPTRVYPRSVYPVKINVVANNDFKGQIVETLPAGFDAIKFSGNGKIGDGSLFDYDTPRKISWDVDWKKGDSHDLTYTVLFPVISPEFYLIGPIKFIDEFGNNVFEEAKPWQVAADAIAVVQAKQTSCSAGTPCAMTLTSSATVGNLIVTSAKTSGSVTLNAPTDNGSTGNTYTLVDSVSGTVNPGGSTQTKTYYAIVNNSANIITWTTTGGTTPIIQEGAVEYSGLDSSSPLDQHLSGTDTSNATSPQTHSTGNVTTGTADEVLYAAWNPGNNSVTWAAGTNYAIEGTSLTRFTQEDRIVASTGTYNATVVETFTGGSDAQYVISTYKIASVPENYKWYLFLSPLLSPIFLILSKLSKRRSH